MEQHAVSLNKRSSHTWWDKLSCNVGQCSTWTVWKTEVLGLFREWHSSLSKSHPEVNASPVPPWSQSSTTLVLIHYHPGSSPVSPWLQPRINMPLTAGVNYSVGLAYILPHHGSSSDRPVSSQEAYEVHKWKEVINCVGWEKEWKREWAREQEGDLAQIHT